MLPFSPIANSLWKQCCILFLGFTLWTHAENAITLNPDPSPEFPRNSEGSLATLQSGRNLFGDT
jgi:hypothetical protein